MLSRINLNEGLVMAECGRGARGERTSIGDIAKGHKKYGSTSNHMKKNEIYIKHTVSSEDTLQGIALKYGVTTEQIRRINKIWMNDSLFLRPSLDIPVSKGSSDTLTFDSTDSPGFSMSCSASGEDVFCATNLTSPQSAMSEELNNIQNSDPTVEELLGRIDSTIAQTKTKVQKMDLNNDMFADCDDDPSSYQRRMQNSQLLRASSDPNVAPHPLVMTQGRKVRSSLQRLEKEKDELFEL